MAKQENSLVIKNARNRSNQKIPEVRQRGAPMNTAPLDDYVITLIDFGLSKRHLEKKQTVRESSVQ